LVKILHFKLHPDDRFGWAAGQSTHYRSTHASKAIGSAPAARGQIAASAKSDTLGIFSYFGQDSSLQAAS
jgi:hypothetical protein